MYLEKETIKNSLAIAIESPDQFACNLMKGGGYMAVVSEEVVHIMKCLPVEVKIAHGKECYTQLQVLRNNETMFMTPKTHILLKQETQVACNSLIPSYYKVGSAWFRITPNPTEAMPPKVIQPQSELTWVYQDPSDLANSGIYFEGDLKMLK